MRLNIYQQEITGEYELWTKEAEGITYIGVRIYLDSPGSLHQTATDNDRSAVVFWTSNRIEEGPTPVALASMFDSISRSLLRKA